MVVIRVTQAAALEDPEIREFFLRAIKANDLPYPEGTIIELQARMNEPQLGIFAGLDGYGKLVALGIAQLPTSNFMLAAWVVLAYNEGPWIVSREIQREMIQWVNGFGLKSLIGINRSRKQDGVWARLWRGLAKPSKLGTVHEFKWE
jgi:hypothetical protein